MSKKIFVLFLSIFVMLFACSSAMAYSYKLLASEDSKISEPTLHEDYEETGAVGIVGYNYSAKYRLPAVSLMVWEGNEDYEDVDNPEEISPSDYTISWDIVSLSSDLKLTIDGYENDASGDIVIVRGVLPETAYDYNFYITAKVGTVTNSIFSDAKGVSTDFDIGDLYLDIDVTEDRRLLLLSTNTASKDQFNECVSPDGSVDLTTVESNYSVTVKSVMTGITSKKYVNYIESEDNKLLVNLPEWLTAEVVSTEPDDYEDTQVTSIKITFKDGVTVKDGTKAVVRVPLTEDEDSKYYYTLGWDVTYKATEEKEEESRPFGISGDKEVSFSFTEAGTSQSKTLTYTGSVSVVSYDLSGDLTSFTTEITSTDLSTDTYTGTITVKITTPSTITTPRADYTGSIIFRDADGASADVAVKITIDITGASFNITPSTTSFTLAPGESKDVTITASNAVSSSSWSVTRKSDDISVDITVSGDYIAVATVTAHEDAAEGKNSVTITATDISGNSKTATLTVIVSSSSESEDAGFSITADPASFDLPPDSTDTVIVTAVNGLVVSWDVSADEGITCEIVTSSDEEAEIDLTVDEDAEDGSYTVIVLAENTSGDTKTATITVTVTSASGDATYSVTLTASSTAVTLPAGGSRDITLTAGGTHSGDLTWTHSLAPTGLVVNVYNTSNTSATARIGVYTTATAGTKSPITVTATDKAGNSASVSITVTVISGDSGSGGGSSTTTGQRTTATATEVSNEVFNKQSVKNLLNSKLGSHNLFKMNVANTVANLSATYKYSGNVISLPMPPSSDITSAGIYICALSYSDFSKVFSDDTPLYLYRTRKEADGSSITVSSVEAAADDSDTLALFDDNGNAISTLSADTSINFAAYLTPGADYEAVATDTLVSSSTDVSGDSKLRAANVGCNAGFGSLFGMLTVMFTASALYLRRKDN